MSRGEGDWMDEIEATLASLGSIDDTLRAAIVREMRAALSAGEAAPRVTVLDGGRGDDLADGDEEDLDDEVEPPRFAVFERTTGPDLAVHLLGGPRPEPMLPPRTLDTGHVRLPADPDVWQTLLHGHDPVAYRVHCDHGELHVAADGALVARLEEGQSVDVEAAVLRVRACGEDPAVGRFLRLG